MADLLKPGANVVMRLLSFVMMLLIVPPQVWAQQRLPIIDMHLHAYAADENGPPPLGLCVPVLSHLSPLDPNREVFKHPVAKAPLCSDPIWSPVTDQALMEQTIRVLERRNIVGVLSGPPDRVRRWHEAAPRRFIPSVEFQLGPNAPSPEALRRLFKDGPFAVLGEVANQYVGIAPDDERMEPFWALAEQLDIPVAIHMGEGPAGAAYLFPTYRARLTSPYLLEEVLIRHPRLRVSVMHCGSPLILSPAVRRHRRHPVVLPPGILPSAAQEVHRCRVRQARDVRFRPDGVAGGDRTCHRDHRGSTLSQPGAEARYFLQQRRSFPPFEQGGHRETSQEVTRGAASARAHGGFWDGTGLIRDRERTPR
jgi:predicted TIM-barrel fold metal-dependent hydrolase